MKKIITLILLVPVFVILANAQKSPRPTAKGKPSESATTAKLPVIFAIINDGSMIEPFAKVEKGKLIQAFGGDEPEVVTTFFKTYYKPKTVYNLIFGGQVAGTVGVIKNNPQADCAAKMAEVSVTSAKAKLKGFVMALATDIKPTKPSSGIRRLPTAPEKAEIEKLVVSEFAKKKIAAKNLKYHNLTALDIDNDGKIEFVGSYWVATSATERAKLFFIADKSKTGKYSFGYSELETVKQADVMNEDIKTVDTGIYHELLLDVLDFNDDGVAEIFTTVTSFEGASFFAYQRNEGKWEKVLEVSNYHCAF